MERRYSSPLREQQQAMTRTRIMEALMAVITDGKITDFTVRDVAARAGVSYASVYRHYPTREVLLDGLVTWVEQLPHMPPMTGTLQDFPAWINAAVVGFEVGGEQGIAVRRALTALNIRPEGTRRRDAQLHDMVIAEVPGIGQSEARQVAAVLRHLSNSAAWSAMRQSHGLTADETAAALSWATEVLIHSLLDQNKEEPR